MDFILVVFIIISTYKLKIRKEIDNDYLSPLKTKAINGIFVMIVFLRHFKTYIDCGRFDRIYFFIDSRIGQLLVVPFLFFSGYGIMFSISNKKAYINKFPIRFLKVLFEFDVVVFMYAFVNYIIGNKFTISKLLASLIGWDNIGNSNWYIFSILIMYIITYISFKFFSRKYSTSILFVYLLTIVYILVIRYVGKESWWYNTVISYPTGMLFYLYKDYFNKTILKNKFYYCAFFFGLTTGFFLCYKFQKNIVLYSLMDICFILILLMILSKVDIGNKILAFLGKYTFEIYILQRIPFILGEMYIDNSYILFICSFIFTCIASIVLNYTFSKLFSLIENKLDRLL